MLYKIYKILLIAQNTLNITSLRLKSVMLY